MLTLRSRVSSRCKFKIEYLYQNIYILKICPSFFGSLTNLGMRYIEQQLLNNGIFLVSLNAHPEIKILIGLYWAFMSYLSYYLSQVSSNFDVISNQIFIWKRHNVVKYLLISDLFLFLNMYKRYNATHFWCCQNLKIFLNMHALKPWYE